MGLRTYPPFAQRNLGVPSSTYRDWLNSTLRSDGATVANYQKGVGIVGAANASRWYNQMGNDIALVLPGVTGNYASSPDSVPLSVTGDIDIDAYIGSFTGSGTQALVSKYGSSAGNRSYMLWFDATTLKLTIITNGTAGEVKAATAAVAAGYSGYVRASIDVDDGAGNNVTKFYTSTDGSVWMQLGATVTVATTLSIFDGSDVVQVGIWGSSNYPFAGKIYRARVYAGDRNSGGTLVFDADFSAQAKDTTSFAESANGATVTINSTAIAVPARIGDATDLVQGIAASQPTINADGSLTFDGTADYMKTAAFSFVQPESVYFVGEQTTWVGGPKHIYDGKNNNGMALWQETATPDVYLFAGTRTGPNLDFAVGVKAVVVGIFNGASSSLTVNKSAPVTGDVGAGTADGFTLGASGGGSGGAPFECNEIILRNVADSAATQSQIIALEASLNGVAL